MYHGRSELIKTLELDYPMIMFLITRERRSQAGVDGNLCNAFSVIQTITHLEEGKFGKLFMVMCISGMGQNYCWEL